MKRRARQRVERCRCPCGSEDSFHAPWCSKGPVTDAALEISRKLNAPENQLPGMTYEEHLANLRFLRGQRAERDDQPTTFREWFEPCERCGKQTLVVTTIQGEKVEQRDFCECQLSPEDQAKNRRVEREWAGEDLRKRARDAVKQQAWDWQQHLARKALECRQAQHQNFKDNVCHDKAQDFEHCNHCEWKRKKRKKSTKAKPSQTEAKRKNRSNNG